MKKSFKILVISLITILIMFNIQTCAVEFYDTIGTRYQGAAEILGELEIIQGVKEGVFEPYRNVTRAEFTKMLVEASLKPNEIVALTVDDKEVNFKDVDKEAWYYKYVVAAVNRRLISGYDDGTFRPNDEITYDEISKLVILALGHVYVRPDNPDGWEVNYLDKMYDLRLFRYTYFLSTHDKANRGNVALIIWNMLKSNTWEVYQRNDVDGFSYRDSGKTLFSHKMISHAFLEGAKISGYVEHNGELFVIINGYQFKLFNRDCRVNFSMIGGNSDVLLKRVEYPEKDVRFEVVGIQTDVGASLYQGTYKELREDGLEIVNKTKLGDDTDFAFVYHYDDVDAQDRTLALNLGKFIIVDNIKIEDKKPEKPDKKENYHSQPANVLENDEIAYRYNKQEDVFTRTITLNKGEWIINDGAVVFKNNERIKWSDVKEKDVLVEIKKDEYYYVSPTKTKETIITDYVSKKDLYSITTSEGILATYENTLFTDYFSKELKLFNKMKEADLKNVLDKKVRLYYDLSERIVRIDLIEDDFTFKDLQIGFYSDFAYIKEGSTQYNKVMLWQDGKVRTYNTSATSADFQKGDLVKYTFDDKKPTIIKSLQAIKNKVSLTDKIRIEKFDLAKLQDKLQYFDDEDIEIQKISHHYDFGKYDNTSSYTVEDILIEDYLQLRNADQISSFMIMDEKDIFRKLIVVDNTESLSVYYGIVQRTYKERSKDGKTVGKLHVEIKRVGGKGLDDYEIDSMVEFDIGDFIKYSVDKKKFTFIEKYSLDVMGYYKDLIIQSVNLDKQKAIESYELNGKNKFSVKDWKITTEEKEYDLNDYDVILLTISQEKGKYSIASATLVTKEKNKLQENDMIAIDEIDGAVIIYRGFND